MRLLFLLIMLAALTGLAPTATAQTAMSALGVLKLIPRDKAAKLARIEARDGTPEPDRWYLIVHDPSEPSGVHEFVVAGKEVVASRPVSQFADAIKAEDVVGSAAIKIDSGRVAKLAREYAEANNASITKINYELKKEGMGAVPMWKVSCFDETGNQVGQLLVTAGKGNVISHEGFASEPQIAKASTESKKKPTPKFDVYAESQVATDAPKASPSPEPSVAPNDDYDARVQRRAYRDDDRRGSPVGDAARSVGRTIRHILPF